MRLLLTIIACLCVEAGLAQADTIQSRSSLYSFERKEDTEAVSCTVLLQITDFPNGPEFANVRFSTTVGWRQHIVVSGFQVAVFNIRIESGKPSGFDAVPIESAFVSGSGYVSQGHLYKMDLGLGEIGYSTRDYTQFLPMMMAVFNGNFQVGFKYIGIDQPRIYSVVDAVPTDVINKYTDCAVYAVKR